MAAGDPVAGHTLAVDGGTGPQTTSSPGFGATTAGNTLLVAVRRGSGIAGTTTVEVSEDGGTNYFQATLADVARNVVSAGGLFLFYYTLLGGTSANLRVRVTFNASSSQRFVMSEYVNTFTWDAGTFADNGVVVNFDSGALATSQIRTLIGVGITGLNTINTLPVVPGTTNALTWTNRVEIDGPNNNPAAFMFDFNGGGQAAGTYDMKGSLTSGVGDNVGSEIYSFSVAGAGPTPTPSTTALGLYQPIVHGRFA